MLDLKREYEPQVYSDIILNDPNGTNDAILSQIASGKWAPNLLLFGPPGAGKSALARAVAKSFFSSHGDTDFYLNRINLQNTQEFNLMKSWIGQRKLNNCNHQWVIFDEADKAPTNVMNELNEILEHSPYMSFILTTNYLGTLSQAIQDRCQAIEISPPSPQQFLKRAQKIIEMEGLEIESKIIIKFKNTGNHTLRQYINGIGSLINFYKK